MLRAQFLILFVIHILDSTFAIRAAYEAGNELWKLHSMLNKTTFDIPSYGYELYELFKDEQNQGIKNQMKKIHEQLSQMEKSLDSKILNDSIKLPPSEILLYRCIDTFSLLIQNIDKYYEEFYQYMTNSDYEANEKLGSSILQIILDVEGSIAMLRKIMTDSGNFLPYHRNILFAIAGYTNTEYTEICDAPRVVSNTLVQSFTIVIIAEIKANLMITLRNIHQLAVGEAWKIINSFDKERFVKHFGDYVMTLELCTSWTDLFYMRACDPVGGIWIQDESFFQLESTFQTTIFRYHWFRCKHDSCNALWNEKYKTCDSQYYDARTSCSGTMAQCDYLSTIEACVLRKGERKFQYVKSKTLGSFGNDSTCPNDDAYMINDGIGWNFTHAACACNCYTNKNKISLHIMSSDVESNMVITGVRFLRIDRILFIQPRMGKLNANGHIVRYSARWVRIPEFEASNIHTINRKNRIFFLDDRRLPAGYVLTGIQFQKVRRGNVTGFAINIFGSPFDYESGRVNAGSRLQVPQNAANAAAGTMLSYDRFSSIRTKRLHRPSPTYFKYVSLERSELADDFGQTTLPLFDAVPVGINLPSALSGIGIFHKAVHGYAGFISLKIYGIAYTQIFHNFLNLHMIDGRVQFNSSEHS